MKKNGTTKKTDKCEAAAGHIAEMPHKCEWTDSTNGPENDGRTCIFVRFCKGHLDICRWPGSRRNVVNGGFGDFHTMGRVFWFIYQIKQGNEWIWCRHWWRRHRQSEWFIAPYNENGRDFMQTWKRIRIHTGVTVESVIIPQKWFRNRKQIRGILTNGLCRKGAKVYQECFEWKDSSMSICQIGMSTTVGWPEEEKNKKISILFW